MLNLAGQLESASGRNQIYAFLMVIFFAMAAAMGMLKSALRHQPLDFVTGDTREYYLYLASGVIDRDLDFSNQIIQHWNETSLSTKLQSRTARGYIRQVSDRSGFIAGAGIPGRACTFIG